MNMQPESAETISCPLKGTPRARSVAQDRALQEHFRQRGFAIQKGLFTVSEAEGLIESIKNAQTIDGISNLNKGSMSFYSGVYSRSEALQAVISQPKVIDFLKLFAGPDIWVRWDQAVAKGPGSGTFPWHQDNAYNHLKAEHFQFWIALTKTTADNGALCLVPQRHRKPLPHIREDNHLTYAGEIHDPVLIEAEVGDVVLFSSLSLHSTTPNVTADARWAYVIEYMSCDDLDPSLDPPYFVVARNGKPAAEFVDWYKGRLNPLNHLRYWRSHASNLKKRLKTIRAAKA